MPSPPTIVVLGAPGAGAQALSAALQAHIAPGAIRILCSLTEGDVLTTGQVLDASLILLMGLDLPCPASERTAQEQADARLRADLCQAGASFQVVYGEGEQRIANALNAIKNIATSVYIQSARGTFDPASGADASRPARLRAWNCEKCSDPECEHRLFTALTGREARPT